MIPEDIIVKLKSVSKQDRKRIGEILIANYKKLVGKIIEEADYANTTGYWKDFIPTSQGPENTLTAKEFILKFGKLIK